MHSTDSLLKRQHELRAAVDPSYTHINEEFLQSAKELYRTAGAAEEGSCWGCSPPTVLLVKNVSKEILFTLQFLNEELNSFHSYNKLTSIRFIVNNKLTLIRFIVNATSAGTKH